MDKSESLNVRLPASLKRDFEAISDVRGEATSDLVRHVIKSFVDANIGCLGDRVSISFRREPHYAPHAWEVRLKLREPSEAVWGGSPVPFAMPRLSEGRIVSDKAYQSVVGTQTGKFGLEMGGTFVDGVWVGHFYPALHREESDPDIRKSVESELRTFIELHLDRFKAKEWT